MRLFRKIFNVNYIRPKYSKEFTEYITQHLKYTPDFDEISFNDVIKFGETFVGSPLYVKWKEIHEWTRDWLFYTVLRIEDKGQDYAELIIFSLFKITNDFSLCIAYIPQCFIDLGSLTVLESDDRQVYDVSVEKALHHHLIHNQNDLRECLLKRDGESALGFWKEYEALWEQFYKEAFWFRDRNHPSIYCLNTETRYEIFQRSGIRSFSCDGSL